MAERCTHARQAHVPTGTMLPCATCDGERFLSWECVVDGVRTFTNYLSYPWVCGELRLRLWREER